MELLVGDSQVPSRGWTVTGIDTESGTITVSSPGYPADENRWSREYLGEFVPSNNVQVVPRERRQEALTREPAWRRNGCNPACSACIAEDNGAASVPAPVPAPGVRNQFMPATTSSVSALDRMYRDVYRDRPSAFMDESYNIAPTSFDRLSRWLESPRVMVNINTFEDFVKAWGGIGQMHERAVFGKLTEEAMKELSDEIKPKFSLKATSSASYAFTWSSPEAGSIR